MLKKIKLIGYFFVIGILPKFFEVPNYLKYFSFLFILIWIEDIYKFLKSIKNENK